MKYISKERLVVALRNLARFRGSVNKQGAQHILPFLALKQKGVTSNGFTSFNESDDFQFFDTFCRVQGGKFPYFDPIASDFRIDTHPHSNVATARKGTFSRAWHAGEFRSTADGEEWVLSSDCIEILITKVLTKQKTVTRIPAIDLAVFLLRKIAFDGKIVVKDVLSRFKKEFGLSAADFTALFDEKIQDTSQFFSDKQLTDADTLGAIDESGVLIAARPDHASNSTGTSDRSQVDPNDPIIKQAVELLLDDGYSAIVLLGPPGSSKSWYAIQIAKQLTDGAMERVFKVQFHRSYQYENFVEGYVPKLDGSGFELRDQIALSVAQQAEDNPELRYVIVIDELSRSDPGRVFGELLTYMEVSRRGEPFILASGKEASLPANVFFVATMNSRDKSVTEIDDAFDRRLAKLSMDPDANILARFLRANGMAEDLQRRLVGFFNWVNQTHYPLGQTFFLYAKDERGLNRIWDHQLKFVFEKAFQYDPATVEQIRERFLAVVSPPPANA